MFALGREREREREWGSPLWIIVIKDATLKLAGNALFPVPGSVSSSEQRGERERRGAKRKSG